MTEPGLNWVRLPGAEDCLSASALADKVELRVGRTLFVATPEAELFVDGFVRGTAQPEGGRVFDVQLQVSRPNGEVLGERALSIEGQACSAIDDAVSLVIAVTLYPRSSLVVAGIPLDPTTAASLSSLFGDEPTDPDPTTLPSVAVSPTPRPRRKPRTARPDGKGGLGDVQGTELSLDAIAALELGQVPGVRVAAGGYVRIFPRGLVPFEAGFAHYFVGTEPVEEGGSVDFELTTGSLTACPWTFFSPELRGCLGLEGGVLTAVPKGLAVTEDPSSDAVLNIVLAAVYRPRIVGPLHLRLGVLVGVPLLQHEFVYQAQDSSSTTLFQTSQVQGRADLGLGVSF